LATPSVKGFVIFSDVFKKVFLLLVVTRGLAGAHGRRYYGLTTIGGLAMILLFTDFGLEGPYTGQVKAVLWRRAPGIPVIDLFADAPGPREAAYLLAAYAAWFDPGSVFLGVVDPGVGGDRPAVALRADGRWFVGPGNGLFELVGRRAAVLESYSIPAPAAPVAASFHGRDIFAPVAAALAAGRPAAEIGLVPRLPGPADPGPDWPDDLPAIVYVDRFGNAVTGLRAETLPATARLRIGGRVLNAARTFSAVPPGTAFWYGNSNGLVELAVNLGRADRLLDADIGTEVEILV